jgi:hypothetical protein
VVVARVDLEGCLDLVNPSWQVEVPDADFEPALDCITSGVPLPVNTEHGNHARDAATEVSLTRILQPVRGDRLD